MHWCPLLVLLLAPGLYGCSHGDSAALPDTAHEEGIRTKGGSASARIWVLIAKGEFAEAEVLIVESTCSGLITPATAQKMLEKLAVLNTKLGEIPARLQRAPDFPSQLKDFTLKAGDYSLATQAQLRLAVKLIEQQSRLMEK
ncbi:hypothetical protein [Hyalangium versicolor]|uniref:hypothetical protein n=1 Tax=Hyalangium versicolor TaxID=2861190 RepID=UPI001CC92BF1|nr:hypothetical protein [Hyalangium versicolor]